MKHILSIFLTMLLSVGLQANYLEKSEYEDNIQKKSQHILDTMYGHHLFSVTAKVDLGKESWTVSYTDRAKIQFNEEKNSPSEKYNILPGYSAIKNLSPNEAVQMPFNSKITKLGAPVIKITLDIVTSKELKKSDVKAADKILTKILMLNSERGDSINFEFQDFPVTKKDEVKVGLPIEAKLMIVVLIITSLFLIVYILLKIKQLNINKEAVKAQQETAKATAAAGGGGGSSAPDPMPEAAAAPVPSGGGDSDVSGFFSFVGPHNIQQFISILKKKSLPVDQLAIVVSYLPPQLSKRCIETLEDAQQVEVVTALSEEKIADKDMLSTLEGDLKSELECSVGGAAKLGPVIATFNDPSKKTFLESIQSNADVYAQVRPTIFLFEDIEKLEDGDIKKLIGALKIEVLAAAIAKDDGGAAKKLKANLTGAAEAMVTQFIDLKKDSLKDGDVVVAQSQVVQQMKQLNDSGAIDVVSKIMG
ncbi:MAG: FliG C-terminal domain-containing protein [Candidatus Marinamargulisbacteria bacterium]